MTASKKFIHCLLLSEFDIDAGACFRCAFPSSTAENLFKVSEKHDNLANDMLPDGAEKVEISSTIFVLNRLKKKAVKRFPVYAFSLNDSSWYPYRGAGAILPETLVMDGYTSTISLCFHDKLLVGPSDSSHMRFEFPDRTPDVATSFISHLQQQAQRLNAYIPEEDRNSEDYIFLEAVGFNFQIGLVMKSSELQNLLKEHHKLVERIDSPTEDNGTFERITVKLDDDSGDEVQLPGDWMNAGTQKHPPLFGCTAVVSKKDNTVRRGGITKAVAAVGPSLAWLQHIFPVLSACATQCCNAKGSEEEVEAYHQKILKSTFECLHAEAVLSSKEAPQTGNLKTLALRCCTAAPPYATHAPRAFTLFEKEFKITLPTCPALDDIVLLDYHFENLLLFFDTKFMDLIFGVLEGKKIVVLSRERTAYDVCQVTMALGIIGSFLNPDFFYERVFPYVSINDTDFSDVPGYIMGTMNPIFENSKVWGWDLLCDLDHHEVKYATDERRVTATTSTVVSSTIATAVGIQESGGQPIDLPPHKAALYTQLMAALQHMQVTRTPLKERCLRLQWIIKEYCQTLVVVSYYEGSSRCEIPKALRNSFLSQPSLVTQCQMAGLTSFVESYILREGETPSLLLCCAALRRCNTGDPFNVLRLLEQLLKIVRKEEEVLLFLLRMPLAVGGLTPLAIQLTHPSAEVRQCAWELLQRVEMCSEGRAAVASMNSFLLVLCEDYRRVRESMPPSYS